MRYYHLIIIVFLLNVSWTATTAQQELFESQVFTTEDGLANLMVSTVYKDRKGFLWIGTMHGLNRFDGYSFKHYTKEEHGLLENQQIKQISEDEQGNLWIYYAAFEHHDTNRKIVIFNPEKGETYSLQDYTEGTFPFDESELAYSNIIDPKKRFWVISRTGKLFLYSNQQFKKIFELEDANFNYFNITIDGQDNIWVSSDKTVICINQSGEVLHQYKFPEYVFGIWVGEDERVWIAHRYYAKGEVEMTPFIWYKEKGSADLKPLNLELKKENISELNLFRDQIGSWYLLRGATMTVLDSVGNQVSQTRALHQNKWNVQINSIFEDDYFIWWGTTAGLGKTVKRKKVFQFIHQSPKSFSNCRGITQDQAGNTFFINGHIYKRDTHDDRLTKMPFLISQFKYLLLQEGSILWVGSRNVKENRVGYEINLETETVISYPNLDKATAYASVKSIFPNRFLLGTNKGLLYIDIDLKSTIPFEKYKQHSSSDSLLQISTVKWLHRNGSGIWLASDNGVFLIDEKEGILNHFGKKEGLPYTDIQHIYEDKQGVFWLATKGGGLIKWQPNLEKPMASTSQQFTTTDGLSNNYLYAVYEDDYNKLWIPSDKGLMCLDKATYLVRVYLTQDGLPNNEFNFTSHYQAKDGTLYFGGIGGLISFHPADLNEDLSNQTPLAILNYQLLEGDASEMTDKTNWLKTSKEIVIQPTDKLFELRFALLDYNDPEEHSYAYQIKGYSERWQPIEENFIRLTNLPYGDYTLNIKGKHSRYGWSSNELSIPIYVLKPFYLQWWFILTLAFIGIGVVFMVIRSRIQRLEQDRQRLETEVEKRTKKIEKDKAIIEKDKAVIEIQAEKLKQLDKAKTRFFSNVTHEFRTPLTLIIGPLEQVIENQPPPNVFKRRLSGVLNNARHLLTLINQMLDLSKIESGGMKTEMIKGDIINYTREFVKRFEPLIEKKEHQFKFSSNQENWETYFDKDKWDKIIYNLLSNALKFTPKYEAVELSLMKTVFKDATAIRLEVKDTGIGIEKEQLDQIFNRFYQVDDSLKRVQGGTGIGLALVKELVELQGGEIRVSSQVNEGTSFEIYLPILKYEKELLAQALELPALPLLNEPPERDSKQAPVSALKKEGKLELLIIEDNEEIREYIQYSLDTSKYNITGAVDGEDGILKAQSIIPDLIISDVMMPRKNGFEVVKEIRKNLATSHIPIILLTAKASLESRLEGLKRGADAYLTKPFSPHELTIRVNKLIELRQNLQQRYHNSTPPAIEETYQKEDEFITELKAYTLKNIDQSNLNGDEIGRQFGMSRVHLYRKLKALTNQSISDFVKQIRLEKAKELLLIGELNISEITYQTGFSSISYFSRAFKKAYGKAPSKM